MGSEQKARWPAGRPAAAAPGGLHLYFNWSETTIVEMSRSRQTAGTSRHAHVSLSSVCSLAPRTAENKYNKEKVIFPKEHVETANSITLGVWLFRCDSCMAHVTHASVRPRCASLTAHEGPCRAPRSLAAATLQPPGQRGAQVPADRRLRPGVVSR